MPRSPRTVHPSQALITDALASQHPKPKRPAVRAKTTKAKVVPIRPGIQMPIAFTVYGQARTQGSKRAFARGEHIVLTEGHDFKSHALLKAWRRLVTSEAIAASNYQMISGSIQVAAKFWFRCPKNKIPGDWHTGRIDLDKLKRAVGDSLTDAEVIQDDCYIATWEGSWKRYCRVGEEPRVEIEIIPLRPPIDLETAQ